MEGIRSKKKLSDIRTMNKYFKKKKKGALLAWNYSHDVNKLLDEKEPQKSKIINKKLKNSFFNSFGNQ